MKETKTLKVRGTNMGEVANVISLFAGFPDGRQFVPRSRDFPHVEYSLAVYHPETVKQNPRGFSNWYGEDFAVSQLTRNTYLVSYDPERIVIDSALLSQVEHEIERTRQSPMLKIQRKVKVFLQDFDRFILGEI